MTPKALFLRWLLFVIRNAAQTPDDIQPEPAEEPFEAIAVEFHGRTFRIRVEEVAV